MTHAATDLESLRRLDLAHHLPAQQNYRLMEQLGGSRIITRAEGCRIYDAEGSALLDGMAGLWCVNVGYGREELARAAYEQMLQLPYYNTFFQNGDGAARCCSPRELAQLTGGELTHFFFSNSGSEANDTAFRLARHYWAVDGQPQRKIFISRWNAYHGSTVAGASLGGMKFMHAQGGLPIPGIEHVMQPYAFGEGFGEEPQSVRRARRAGHRGAHSRSRAGECRGVHRRAGAGRGRRDHSAAGLLAARRGHLPQARHPAHLRRSHLRVRAAGQVVRPSALRRQAGPRDDGEGAVLGLPADLGDGVSRAHRRGAQDGATTSSHMATPIQGTRRLRPWR